MILITQFWNFRDPERKSEIYDCLLRNVRNNLISNIYIYNENFNDKISLKHNKIHQIKVDGRLSYYDMFKSALQNFNSQVVIIANADVYFDKSISELKRYDFNNKVLALSSYDSVTKRNYFMGIDSFIFKSSSIPYSEYKIGIPHDDLRFLNSLIDNNIEVKNPSLDIISTQIDSMKINRKFKLNDKLKYLSPVKLNTYQVLEENKVTDINININKNNIHINKKVSNKENISPPTSNNITTKIIIERPKYRNKKIAVILHLYYQDLWEEFDNYLTNLKGLDFKLYITLTKGSATLGQIEWITNIIKNKYKNSEVFITNNIGLDIGPYLYVINYIFKNENKYDYILKLHTKKSVKTSGEVFGRSWRSDLLSPLIGNRLNVDRCLDVLQNETNGMVGSKKWITNNKGLNQVSINYYKNLFNININNSNETFIGGTMFWVRFDVIERYFKNININEIIEELEENYFIDHHSDTKTHSLERIFGYMVIDSGKKILGF